MSLLKKSSKFVQNNQFIWTLQSSRLFTNTKEGFIVCVQTAVEINNNGRRLSQINTITQSPDQNFTRFFLLIILFAKLHFARNVLCTCSASYVVVTQPKHKHIKSIQESGQCHTARNRSRCCLRKILQPWLKIGVDRHFH